MSSKDWLMLVSAVVVCNCGAGSVGGSIYSGVGRSKGYRPPASARALTTDSDTSTTTGRLPKPSPEDYKSSMEFLNAYEAYKYSYLSEEDKADDKKRVGGVSARKKKFRSEGMVFWNQYMNEKKEADRSASLKRAERKAALSGKPLSSLFGITLGGVVDPAKYERVGQGRTYRFMPEKKFKSFSDYTFSITPETHVVYGIRARSVGTPANYGENVDAAEVEWQAVKGIMEKKFDKKSLPCTDTSATEAFELIFPGPDGQIARKIVLSRVANAVRTITAVDLKLKEVAAREAESMKQSANENALADALDDGIDAL